ncbi:hypothetical protein KAX14_03580 [Candidatus Bipolaricaulota bacterium]|nr:hypothetical protein [Candidatus Bipolaricaulota bacterium]
MIWKSVFFSIFLFSIITVVGRGRLLQRYRIHIGTTSAAHRSAQFTIP